MRIMPKTGAFEAIVLGLSEQSRRHQSAIAAFAERALVATDIDALMLDACRACARVLHVSETRILEFQHESGLKQRHAYTWDVNHDKDDNGLGWDIPALPAAHASAGNVYVMAGSPFARVISTTSASIESGDQRFGLLELDRPHGREFGELEVDFISSIARLLGRAIHRNNELESLRLTTEELARQVDEGQLQLRELQHRVRNDLQAIEGQIYLDQRKLADADGKTMLGMLARRVMAMSNLYDHLLASDTPQMADFGDYLSALCVRIQDAQEFAAREIILAVETVPARLPASTASGLGIAVNELVANAAEHAFPAGEGGRISLKLTVEQTETGRRATLIVRDNGCGMTGKPEEAGANRGLAMVQRLLRHHSATMRRLAEPGTVWELTFACA